MGRSNPFVGPRPLGAQNAVHGRDRELRELRNLLTSERIVLLHSPSGAGKSSLINGQGGLIDTLDERFDVWIPARVNSLPSEGNRELPNRFLWSVMYELERQFNDGKPQEPPPGVTLKSYVEMWRQPKRPTVLIFDQFEEILRIDPLKQEAKREFFKEAGELLLDEYMWALFVLREDYLAPLEPYRRMIPTHLRNRYRLDLLSAEEARAAMMKTASGGGREFSKEAADQLAKDLSLNKVQTISGVELMEGPVQPLILQVACYRLWEEVEKAGGDAAIGIEEVKKFGKVTEALSEYYTSIVRSIAGDDFGLEWAIRDWCGERLIVGGIRSQVQRGSEGLDPLIVEKLVNSHMVRADERGSSVWYELSHDRLIDPIVQSNALEAKSADFDGYYAKKVAAIAEGDKGRERLIRNWVDELIQSSRKEGGDLDGRDVEELRKARLIRALPDGLFELMHGRLKAQLLSDNEKWRDANLLAFQKTAWLWRKDRPKGLLIASREQLREAQAAAKTQTLSPYEKDYVEESAERLGRRRLLTVIIVVAVIATALASLFADNRRRQLNRMSAVALSRAAGSAAVRVKAYRLDAAVLLAVQAMRFANTYEARNAMMSVHMERPEVEQYRPDLSWEDAFAVSSDGSMEAQARGKSLTIRVSGKVTQLPDQPEEVVDLAFRPGTKTVAVAGRTVRFLHIGEVGGVEQLTTGAAIRNIAFSPDGRVLAVRTDGGSVQLWDMTPSNRKQPYSTIRLATTKYSNDAYCPRMAFQSDGSVLAVPNSEGVTLREVRTGAELGTIEGFVTSISFHHKLKLLAIAGYSAQMIDVSNPTKPRGTWFWRGERNEPTLEVAFQPDGDLLAVGSGSSVHLWNVSPGNLSAEPEGGPLDGHRSSVKRIVMAPNQKIISSAWGNDNGSIVWKVPTHGETQQGSAVAFHPKSGELVRVEGERIVMGSKIFPASLVTHYGVVRALMDAGGDVLATVDMDGLTILFDAARQTNAAQVVDPKKRFFGAGAAFHPSKKILAAQCSKENGNAFCLWDVSDVRNPKLMGSGEASEPRSQSLSFSHDGQLLAVVDGTNIIGIWNVADPKHPQRKNQVEAHRGVVDAVFHPKQNVIAYTCDDGSISYWSEGVKHREAAAGHNSDVQHLAFNPDGTVLASAEENGIVNLWDFEKGDRLGEPLRRRGRVKQVAFRGDGAQLASSDDGSVEVWDIKPTAESLCARANRNLTVQEWKLYVGEDVDYEKTCAALPAGSGVSGAEADGWLKRLMRKLW